MALDLAALVAPVAEDAPSGPDLSYENERAEIEKAFDRSVSDGEETERSVKEWRDTIKLVLAEAAKTRDIWLPVYFIRAAVGAGDFGEVVEGTEFLAKLLEERWDDVHPQLDEYGFIGRKAPCESLVSKRDFLIPFGKMPLLSHQRLGQYSGEVLERLHREGPAASEHGMFMAWLEAADDAEWQTVLEQLERMRAAIRSVDTKLTENAEGDTATNFEPLYEALDTYHKALGALTGSAEPEAAVEDGAAAAAGGDGAPTGGKSVPGAINSRDDVIRALDAIDSYYRRHEPGSPVPFALRRARDWISLDFMAVLQDIAPGSVDEANRVLKGIRSGAASSGASAAPDEGGGSNDSGW